MQPGVAGARLLQGLGVQRADRIYERIALFHPTQECFGHFDRGHPPARDFGHEVPGGLAQKFVAQRPSPVRPGIGADSVRASMVSLRSANFHSPPTATIVSS